MHSHFLFHLSSAENKGVNSTRLVACITTLYLFSKIRAQLMVKHAMTMQPYLTTKCNVSCVLNPFCYHIIIEKINDSLIYISIGLSNSYTIYCNLFY